MIRYAMYGGSFDPIHTGHLSVVERAIALGYTVLVVPAYRHAFGKQSAPFEQRVRMCELALQACGFQQQAQVCTIERTLAEGSDTPVYTYDVLCALRARLQAAPCLLVALRLPTCSIVCPNRFGLISPPIGYIAKCDALQGLR
jgi:nicotinate-nucleotide adenylyltransferase